MMKFHRGTIPPSNMACRHCLDGLCRCNQWDRKRSLGQCSAYPESASEWIFRVRKRAQSHARNTYCSFDTTNTCPQGNQELTSRTVRKRRVLHCHSHTPCRQSNIRLRKPRRRYTAGKCHLQLHYPARFFETKTKASTRWCEGSPRNKSNFEA